MLIKEDSCPEPAASEVALQGALAESGIGDLSRAEVDLQEIPVVAGNHCCHCFSLSIFKPRGVTASSSPPRAASRITAKAAVGAAP